MRINLLETQALIIDYQEKLVPVMKQKENLIHNTEILIKGLNILEVPLTVTQQYTKGLGMTIDSVLKAVNNKGQYFDKISFSILDDITIEEKIRKNNRKNIIICGIEAHICVLQSVIDLIEKGYQVILVADCISSRKEMDKKYGIKRAMKEGAIITTYEAILFELTRRAGSDIFKEVSRLIR